MVAREGRILKAGRAVSGKLIDLVRRLATQRVSKFFHSNSNTHIFFQPCVGALGVKGVADFADEAYAHYVRELDQRLELLSESELKLAHVALLQRTPGIDQRREMQFEVPAEVKAWLVLKAGDLKLAEFVRMVVMRALPEDLQQADLKLWYQDISDKIETLHLSKPRRARKSISVRWTSDNLIRVRQLASTFGERDSNLIRMVILAGYADDHQGQPAH